jgi:hypothetical protein
MNKANQGKKILERIWEVWEAGMIKVTMTTHNQKMGKKGKEKKIGKRKTKRRKRNGNLAAVFNIQTESLDDSICYRAKCYWSHSSSTTIILGSS